MDQLGFSILLNQRAKSNGTWLRLLASEQLVSVPPARGRLGGLGQRTRIRPRNVLARAEGQAGACK